MIFWGGCGGVRSYLLTPRWLLVSCPMDPNSEPTTLSCSFVGEDTNEEQMFCYYIFFISSIAFSVKVVPGLAMQGLSNLTKVS